MNLLTETIRMLESFEKCPGDVFWVGSLDGTLALSWDEWATLADEDYDDCRGRSTVAVDLVVVGDTWWLSRDFSICDDGIIFEEWWIMNYKPMPHDPRPYAKVFDRRDSFRNLKQVNDDGH